MFPPKVVSGRNASLLPLTKIAIISDKLKIILFVYYKKSINIFGMKTKSKRKPKISNLFGIHRIFIHRICYIFTIGSERKFLEKAFTLRLTGLVIFRPCKIKKDIIEIRMLIT